MMVENRWGEGERNRFFFVLCKWLVMWFTFVKSWELLMFDQIHSISYVKYPHSLFLCVRSFHPRKTHKRHYNPQRPFPPRLHFAFQLCNLFVS